MAEIELENLLNNLPNLLDLSLHKRKGELNWTKGKLGDVNVFLRQEALIECDGVLDLCFVTDSVVHLAELKDDIVSESTLDQLNRYLPILRKSYPNHEVRGYLVGKRCPDKNKLEQSIGGVPITIILIPNPNSYTDCNHCGAGVDGHLRCPVCGKAPKGTRK